jgi:hypothetical protein
MLDYLDALITALTLRDAPEAARLLGHPLARLLSTDVCEEAGAFVSGERDALAVPLRTMQLRRQTAELLQEAPALADARIDARAELRDEARNEPRAVAPGHPTRPTRPPGSTRRTRPQQMELPLSA